MSAVAGARNSSPDSRHAKQNRRYLFWLVILGVVTTLTVPRLGAGPRNSESAMATISRLHSLRTATCAPGKSGTARWSS
jgi:hypothetical protein